MTSHSPADLEEFMASPEMEAAFNAWLAKRNPAMVDLSEGALEVFPAIAPDEDFRYWQVAGRARDGEGQILEIDRLTYALRSEASYRTLINQEYDLFGNANHTLEWVDEPSVSTPRHYAAVLKSIEAGKFAPDVTDDSIALAFDLSL